MLAHLGRAGRAVEPDQVDAERLQGGERGADLGAEQHGAGGLDGHVGDQRERRRPAAAIARRAPMIAALACSRSWQVSMRIASTPPREQPPRPALVGVAQVGEAGVAEGRQLGARARPSRAPSGAAPAVAHASAASRAIRAAGLGQLGDPVGDARTRPGCRGSRRRCWSRRSRRRPRGSRRGSARTMSGRVTLRISLQPSWPSKSSSVGVAAPGAWCPSPRRPRPRDPGRHRAPAAPGRRARVVIGPQSGRASSVAGGRAQRRPPGHAAIAAVPRNLVSSGSSGGPEGGGG